MRSTAFALVFISAFMHATWNTAIRHLKGNTPVLVFAHFIGTVMCLPLVIYLDHEFYATMAASDTAFTFVASSLVHAMYVMLLSTAYVYGDVGLVYPLARGTAIVLSTWGSRFVSADNQLSVMESGGVAVVVLGILGLFLDAFWHAMGKSAQFVEPVDAGEDAGLLGDVELPVKSAPASGGRQHGVIATSADPGRSQVRRQLLISVALALCVGCCTASYSVLDAIGVRRVSSLTWSFCMNFLSMVLLLPCMPLFYREQATEALQVHWRVILLIAPFAVGAYLLVLFVFSFPDVNVALVVTLREFAVLVGAALGVLFLNERCTLLKFASIICMLLGMVLIKVA